MVVGFFSDYANRVGIILAVGLLLFIAHYPAQPLLQYVFLPQIGAVLLLCTVFIVLFNRRDHLKEVGLGPKVVWIPLAIISGSAVLRLLLQQDVATLAGALFMVAMFGVYVVSRQYGEKTLRLFAPIAIAGVVSIVIQAFITGQPKNAGFFNNYATASQFLIFAWVVSPRKQQWWLSAIILVGLMLSGAEEALFYIGVLGAVIVVRRDWGRRILLPIGAVGLVLVLCVVSGFFPVLYLRAASMAHDLYTALSDPTLSSAERDALLNRATNGRWLNGWRLHRPVAPLGYGVNITYHYKLLPHNIALLVTDQLGPVAAVAWVVAMVGGIKSTKRKYGFLALILFGLFQPFVWTEMAPYMWAFAGMATMPSSKSSFIFREGYA